MLFKWFRAKIEEKAKDRKFWRKIHEISKSPHAVHKLDDADMHRYIQYLQKWESCTMAQKETSINIQDIEQLIAKQPAIAKDHMEKEEEPEIEDTGES